MESDIKRQHNFALDLRLTPQVRLIDSFIFCVDLNPV